MPAPRSPDTDQVPSEKFTELLVADLARAKVRDEVNHYRWLIGLPVVILVALGGLSISRLHTGLAELGAAEEELGRKLETTEQDLSRRAEKAGQELVAELEKTLATVEHKSEALQQALNVVEQTNERSLDRIDRQAQSIANAGRDAIETTVEARHVQEELQKAVDNTREFSDQLKDELARVVALRRDVEAQLSTRFLLVERGMKKYPHNHNPAQVDAFRPGTLVLGDHGTLTVTFHAYEEASDQIQLGEEPPMSSVRIGTKTAILDLRVDGTLVRENLRLRQGGIVRVPEIGHDIKAVFIYLPNPKGAGYIPDFVWLQLTALPSPPISRVQ